MLIGCERQPQAVTETPQVLVSAAVVFKPGGEINLGEYRQETAAIKPQSKEDPVGVHFSFERKNAIVGEVFELAVVLSVDSGYEIYSRDASAPKIPTVLELELPTGFTPLDEWESPSPVRSFNPEGASVYRGEAKFRREIQIANNIEPGDYLLTCTISYQACNSRQCIRPMKVVLGLRAAVSD